MVLRFFIASAIPHHLAGDPLGTPSHLGRRAP
jgi:hypothetical protein